MTHHSLLPVADTKPVGFDDWTKTAGTRLSVDARLWQTEIVAQIAAAHPYLPVEELTVEFNRIDPVKGAAVGSVKVGNTGVTIPLVVKRMRSGADPELAPTDIFYAEGRYQPLTPDSVKSAMQSREIGAPMTGPQTGRAVGGNPYIGDLTGDASPLEFSGQGGPFAGPFGGKTSALDAKKLPDQAKGAIMGAMAFGGHRALRELEIQNRDAAREGKKLTVKDKAKAVAKGVVAGGAVGAVAGGVGTHVAKKLDLDSPFMRKRAGVEAPSIRDLSDELDVDVEKVASRGDAWGYVGQKARAAGASKHVEALLAAARHNPVARNALIGGVVGAGMGAANDASQGGSAVRGGVRGGVIGAAGGAASAKLHQKLGSLCEELVKSASIHPNDLANFRALLATNPQVLQGAAATNLRMVELILKHKGPGAQAPGVKVTNPNVMILLKDPLTGMTRVKFTGGPSETLRNESEIKKLLGDRYTEAKASLLAHGAYVVAEEVQQVSWDASRQDASGAKPVERDGMYAIRDRAGGTAMGNVVMQMIQPNGMTVPMRLFVSADGRYAVSPELFGVRVSGRNRLPSSKAKKADHGVFVTYVNGTPIASTPMIIESVATLTGGPSDVRGDDFVVYNVRNPINGEQLALVPSRAVQSFVRLREIDPTKMALTRGDIYLMPADCEWVKFTGRIEVAKAADQIVKISDFTDDARATKVAFIDGGFRIEQLDRTWADCEEIDAWELLAGMGVTKAAELRDISDQVRARRGEAVALRGLHEPELTAHTIKEAEAKTFPIMERLTKGMRPTDAMLKVAAATGDEQALDVMLGLNFITPQNVRLFTESIDQFDEVASKLASLLLASRLGLQHVREDAIKEAMEGIARTGEQLRLLQSAAQFKRQEQAPGS